MEVQIKSDLIALVITWIMFLPIFDIWIDWALSVWRTPLK